MAENTTIPRRNLKNWPRNSSSQARVPAISCSIRSSVRERHPWQRKKLGRRYTGIESDLTYACIAEKRLEAAARDKRIQGYSDGVFWERNSLKDQPRVDK